MSPKIIILGPDDRLTITPPRAPTPRVATSELLEAEGGEVVMAVNGRVLRLPAFEEIVVSSEILSVLVDAGIEFEHLDKEEEPRV